MTVVCSEAYLALKNICILFPKAEPIFCPSCMLVNVSPKFPLLNLPSGTDDSPTRLRISIQQCTSLWLWRNFFKKMFARLTCILHSRKLALKLSYDNHLDCIVLSQKYVNHGIQSINQRKKKKPHIF